jgi:hypothetical protein
MILIGRIIRLYTERQQKKKRGERVLRESTTLSAAAEVWSDVASTMELGFRSSDAGPLLYGELDGGPQLEIGVYEGEYDAAYRTVATTTAPEGAKKGNLVVQPLRGFARVAKALVGAPDVPEALEALYFVRASDPALVTRFLHDEAVQRALVDLADRGPFLSWDDGSATLVLEGVELVHERMETLIRALSKLGA